MNGYTNLQIVEESIRIFQSLKENAWSIGVVHIKFKYRSWKLQALLTIACIGFVIRR